MGRNPAWDEWSNRTQPLTEMKGRCGRVASLVFDRESFLIDLLVDDERRRTALLKVAEDFRKTAESELGAALSEIINKVDPEPSYFSEEKPRPEAATKGKLKAVK